MPTLGFVEGRTGGHAAHNRAVLVDVAAGESEGRGEKGEGGEGDLHLCSWLEGGWWLLLCVAKRSLWLRDLSDGVLDIDREM